MKKIIKPFIILLLFAILILSFYWLSSYAYMIGEERGRWQTFAAICVAEAKDFSARPSVVIKDLSRDWKIRVDDNTLVPSASLAKIPIMASCFYAMKEGRLNPNAITTLKNSDKTGGSGILKNRPAGSRLSIEELIDMMITKSDNTATNMLISMLGFSYLNNCFKKFGLEKTNISRLMMDMRSRSKGIENYTTAKDLAIILEKIYKGNLIDKNISNKCLELLKRQTVNDRIPAKLPSGVVVAHKTGLERNVCHDAGIVFTKKGDFLIVVLVKHNHKNARQSKSFISRIALLSYNFFTNNKKSDNFYIILVDKLKKML